MVNMINWSNWSNMQRSAKRIHKYSCQMSDKPEWKPQRRFFLLWSEYSLFCWAELSILSLFLVFLPQPLIIRPLGLNMDKYAPLLITLWWHKTCNNSVSVNHFMQILRGPWEGLGVLRRSHIRRNFSDQSELWQRQDVAVQVRKVFSYESTGIRRRKTRWRMFFHHHRSEPTRCIWYIRSPCILPSSESELSHEPNSAGPQ